MSSAIALRPRHAAAILLGLGFTGACSALPGGGGDDGGPSAITVPDNNQRVTSVLCTSPTSCVFGTDSSSGDPTHLYATDGQNVTTLVTADDAYAGTVNVMGPDVPFGPLAKIGDTIYEQFLGETGFVVTAKGNPMQPGSWTTVPVGDEGGGDTWGIGAQVALANAGGKWTYFSSRQILEATTRAGQRDAVDGGLGAAGVAVGAGGHRGPAQLRRPDAVRHRAVRRRGTRPRRRWATSRPIDR